MFVADYKELTKIGDSLKWFCGDCNPQVGKILKLINDFREKHKKLEKRVKKLESEVQHMDGHVQELTVTVVKVDSSVTRLEDRIESKDDTIDNVIEIILDDRNREEKEKEKRSKNVMVHNVP